MNATGNSAIQNDGIMNNIYEFNNTPINPKTTITIDPIKNTTVENTVIISGKLLDENQKPITNAKVKIGVKDPESKNKYNVITDENGVYTKYTMKVYIWWKYHTQGMQHMHHQKMNHHLMYQKLQQPP